MKTLILTLLLTCIFAGCQKEIHFSSSKQKNKPPKEDKQLYLRDFGTFLTVERTYKVTAYFDSNGNDIPIDPIYQDDTYTWNGECVCGDGWVTSIEPCRETHYNWTAYADPDGSIKFTWLTIDLQPVTYTVVDYKLDEWFIVKFNDTYIKYSLT